jgi:hypothetical protein
MRWALDGIAQVAGTGRILITTAVAILIAGGRCLPAHAADIQKGVPETPSGAAAVAGTYCCHDGNAYRVVLILNSNGTYWAKDSSCLKNKGDASGVGTWKLTERRIVLTPSQEAGWMKKEPKVFDVLKFKGDWIFVRADWPDYYNRHGVTDVSCFRSKRLKKVISLCPTKNSRSCVRSKLLSNKSNRAPLTSRPPKANGSA